MRNIRLLVEFASIVMPGAVLLLLLLGLYAPWSWLHEGLPNSALGLTAGLALSFALGHLLQGVAQVTLDPLVDRVRLQGPAHWALLRFAGRASSRYLSDAQLALLEAQFPLKLGIDFPTPGPAPVPPPADLAPATASEVPATGTTPPAPGSSPTDAPTSPLAPPTAAAPAGPASGAPAVEPPDHLVLATIVAHIEAYLYAAKVNERLEDLVTDHKLNKGFVVAFLLVALCLVGSLLGLGHLPPGLPPLHLLAAALVAAGCALVRLDHHGRKFAQSLYLLFLTAPAPGSRGEGGGGGGAGRAGGQGGGGGIPLGGGGGGGGRGAHAGGAQRVPASDDDDE